MPARFLSGAMEGFRKINVFSILFSISILSFVFNFVLKFSCFPLQFWSSAIKGFGKNKCFLYCVFFLLEPEGGRFWTIWCSCQNEILIEYGFVPFDMYFVFTMTQTGTCQYWSSVVSAILVRSNDTSYALIVPILDVALRFLFELRPLAAGCAN